MKRISILLALALLCSSCAWFQGEKRILLNEQNGELLVSNLQDLSQFDALSNQKIEWGIGKTKLSNGQPRDPVEANQTFGKYNAVFIGPESKQVYLTFDNGYENGNTPKILDILKEKNVPAIFFLTGDYVKDNKELIQRMLADGHVVGNHGYRHKSFPTLTSQELSDEIMKLDEMMKADHNYDMALVRPPKGEFSERSLAVSRQLGYQTLFWSFAYLDFDVNDQPSPEKSLERSLAGLHPGAIYLLHSLSNTNVEILPDLIDQIRAQGYSFHLYQPLLDACKSFDEIQFMCR